MICCGLTKLETYLIVRVNLVEVVFKKNIDILFFFNLVKNMICSGLKKLEPYLLRVDLVKKNSFSRKTDFFFFFLLVRVFHSHYLLTLCNI